MRQILLVDDNPIQAATRRIILERSDAVVKVASSGIEALDFLADPAEMQRTHLVITDHLMPGMNGPELVRLLRERGVKSPILVLSGLPDAEAQYDGLQVVSRLKPFHPDALIALVQELTAETPMQRTA